MKITIKKGDILGVLSRIQGLTSRKSNLAITENVMLTTTDNGIKLMATDLETGIEGSYPAVVEKEGSLSISAKKFYEIVREFPNQDIEINEVENKWIEIGSPDIQYHIVGMDSDEFPENPNVDEIELFEMESSFLKKMIEKSVMISGATDDKRAHITGTLFERIEIEDDILIRMVSTDGSRLSKADYQVKKDADVPIFDKIIIPKKGLMEIAKFLSLEGTVRVGIKKTYFIAKKETETVIIRLLEGEFPEYADIIKKENRFDVMVDRAQFTMMLKRMSILSSESYKGAVFDFGQDSITVSATNPEIGESKEDMAINFSRDPIKVAFNPKYFIEILNAIETEKALINIVSEEKPCVIEGENDKTYLGVIMPMRI